MTKEEFFNQIPFLDINGDYFNIPKSKVLDAMEEYAKQEAKVFYKYCLDKNAIFSQDALEKQWELYKK